MRRCQERRTEEEEGGGGFALKPNRTEKKKGDAKTQRKKGKKIKSGDGGR
jgi:hypothetical protein